MSDESVQKPASTQKPFSTPEMVALEAELAVTRAQLASTVDELVARLDPRAQAGRAVASVGHLGATRRAATPRRTPARRRSL